MTFFLQKNCFKFGPWGKRVSPFRENAFRRLVKTALNLSRKNFFFRKKNYSSHFRCLTELFLAFYSKNFSKFVRTAFSVSRGTSCEFFAEKNPTNFGQYQHYGEIFPASLTKLNSKCARKLFEGIWFCEKKLLFSWLPDVGRNQRDLLKKYFQ